MSKEKHRHKKKRHKNGTNDNDNQNERPHSSLFNEADAKSVEVSGYTVGRGAPQTNNQVIGEKVIPTGVGKLIYYIDKIFFFLNNRSCY